MKKLRLIFTTAICITLASLTAISVCADVRYIKGDANSDGNVDIRDVTKVQKVIAGIESDSIGMVKRSCDFDNNGLTISDATRIQKYLAKLDNPYSIGKEFTYDEYELPFIPAR